MNTTSLIAAFVVVVSGLIWAGTHSNNADWTGNRNQCVGECYEDWKAENGGSIAAVEEAKQLALAAASPCCAGREILWAMHRLPRKSWRGRYRAYAGRASGFRYRREADGLSGWRRTRCAVSHDVSGG